MTFVTASVTGNETIQRPNNVSVQHVTAATSDISTFYITTCSNAQTARFLQISYQTNSRSHR